MINRGLKKGSVVGKCRQSPCIWDHAPHIAYGCGTLQIDPIQTYGRNITCDFIVLAYTHTWAELLCSSCENYIISQVHYVFMHGIAFTDSEELLATISASHFHLTFVSPDLSHIVASTYDNNLLFINLPEYFQVFH